MLSRTKTIVKIRTEHFELRTSGLYFVEVVAGNRERMLFRVARVD